MGEIAGTHRDVTSQQAGLIGAFIGKAEACQTPEMLDRPTEVAELERRYWVLEYIRGRYALAGLSPKEQALAPLTRPMHSVEQIGNQFATKLIPAFLNPNPEEGLVAFREISPHTTQEEMALLANDDQFRDMHSGLQQHLAEAEPEIEKAVAERLDPNVGQINVNDRLQFRGIETARSLENIRQSGVQIEVDPNTANTVEEAVKATGEGMLPVTELTKNARILNINGFEDSKISHAVHDVMDHAWVFNMLEQRGYLDEYSDLLASIGNPHLTNIFLREGEAVASIAYGVRYWAMMEQGFKPLFTASDIRDKMERMFDDGELTQDRHMRAYKILRLLDKDPNSREAQSLGFTFSNYFVELDEQRRKHGKIKQRDPRTHRVVKELDVFDPDYLSLFVETHHEILSSANKHRNDLFVFHILLEEYLKGVGEGQISPDQTLTIKAQDLRTIDVSQTSLPAERLRWMFRNYGFTSVKDSIY